MGITTEAGYTTAKANGKAAVVNKTSIANQVAGNLCSLWRATGIPTQPAIPGAAAVCDRTTAGALRLDALTTGDTRYIDGFDLNATVAGTVWAFDRVIHSGGLSGTLTTVQNVNTPALPARVAAAEVDWYLECYADLGGTGVTATVNVTYTDATSGTPTVAVPATLRAGRMLQIVPAAGKVIASVQSVQLSATTGTAGSFGVTAVKRLPVAAKIVSANIGDGKESMLRKIAADACLMLGDECSGTSTGQVTGALNLIEG